MDRKERIEELQKEKREEIDAAYKSVLSGEHPWKGRNAYKHPILFKNEDLGCFGLITFYDTQGRETAINDRVVPELIDLLPFIIRKYGATDTLFFLHILSQRINGTEVTGWIIWKDIKININYCAGRMVSWFHSKALGDAFKAVDRCRFATQLSKLAHEMKKGERYYYGFEYLKGCQPE
ncbi:MAG: hypothetical protein WC831_00035 [Parcubacteria group bacterium]|jgi:hypothetical protein